MDDYSRREWILAQLEPEDAAWLREQLDPAWLRRRRRLAERDRLIRAVIRQFSPGPPTVAAAAMASALSAYALAGWRSERHLAVLPDSVSSRHRAQHAVLRANNGKPLGWRRIAEVLGPARNSIGVEKRHHAKTEAAGPCADRCGPRLQNRIGGADSARKATG